MNLQHPATGKNISNGAMLIFLKRQFPTLKVTVHGFRSSFRDWAEETGLYQHHAIEFCLAHELLNKVEKAYLKFKIQWVLQLGVLLIGQI